MDKGVLSWTVLVCCGFGVSVEVGAHLYEHAPCRPGSTEHRAGGGTGEGTKINLWHGATAVMLARPMSPIV